MTVALDQVPVRRGISSVWVGFAFTLLYRFTLDNSYPVAYSMYRYYGIQYAPDIISIIESYLVVAVLYLLIARRTRQPSVVAGSVLFYFFFIPFSSYYALSGESPFFFYLVSGSFLLFFLATYVARPVLHASISGGRALAYWIIAAFIGSALGISLVLYGLPSLTALDITNVYQLRSGLESNAGLALIRGWVLYAISPLICGYAVLRGKYLYLLIPISISMFFYLSTGAKYSFFITVLSIFIAFGTKWNRIHLLFPMALSVSAAVSVILYKISPLYLVAMHLLVFRPLVIPSWLSFEYFHFFDRNGFLYFAEHFPALIASPYDSTSAILIGEKLFGADSGTWASNGMFGHGYSNAGWAGMLIFALLYCLVLIIADIIYLKGRRADFSVAFAASSNHLIHTSLLTLLTSRGLAFVLLLGWLLNSSVRARRHRYRGQVRDE